MQGIKLTEGWIGSREVWHPTMYPRMVLDIEPKANLIVDLLVSDYIFNIQIVFVVSLSDMGMNLVGGACMPNKKSQQVDGLWFCRT